MTDADKTRKIKKRAHEGTIYYLERQKLDLILKLQKNRRQINLLAEEQRAHKKGIFYLINLIRLQEGKDPHVWSEKERKVIRKIKPRSSGNIILPGYSAVIDNKYALTILEVVSQEEETKVFMDFLELIGKNSFYKINPPTFEAHKTRIILID